MHSKDPARPGLEAALDLTRLAAVEFIEDAEQHLSASDKALYDLRLALVQLEGIHLLLRET